MTITTTASSSSAAVIDSTLAPPPPSFEIWKLPDEVLYHVACYVAAPTHRAQVLVFQVALLNKTAAESLCTSPTLWDCVLHGDYHPTTTNNKAGGEDNGDIQDTASTRKNKKPSSSSSTSSTLPAARKKRKLQPAAIMTPQRQSCRSSERLRRSPMERVRDAHQLMLDHTEIAYSYLWECCYATHSNQRQRSSHRTTANTSTTATNRRKRNSLKHSGYLTKAKLVGILHEYGPCLRYHRVMSTGGTMLVEVCRAKQVPKATILACVKELIHRAGPSCRQAMLRASTQESAHSHLTPLCVAAVRAMPHVVRFLLQQGADPETRCSGRFKCQTTTLPSSLSSHSSSSKSVQGRNVTALEFAKLMQAAEVEAGAAARDLTDLNECIKLLSKRTHTHNEYVVRRALDV